MPPKKPRTTARVSKPQTNGVSGNHGDPNDSGDNDLGTSDAETGTVDVLGPRQDPRERRDIREQYSRIKDDIQGTQIQLSLIRPPTGL